ncbi:hypothetical protein EVAR_69013_1 [Eumeta japonica]|uniref:Uncharacterized protein n=1 Tax=Eumeta variegata TaxID=151549 RepID=A0A4C2A7X2_EUMVA|nr:hypothetical protein EVAR_69013_1 [Eumeta japonica]
MLPNAEADCASLSFIDPALSLAVYALNERLRASEFVSDNDSEMFQDDVFGELVQYLTSMRASFEKYFPEEQNTKMKLSSWIRNTFLPNLQKPEMCAEVKRTLCDHWTLTDYARLDFGRNVDAEGFLQVTLIPNFTALEVYNRRSCNGCLLISLILPFFGPYVVKEHKSEVFHVETRTWLTPVGPRTLTPLADSEPPPSLYTGSANEHNHIISKMFYLSSPCLAPRRLRAAPGSFNPHNRLGHGAGSLRT